MKEVKRKKHFPNTISISAALPPNNPKCLNYPRSQSISSHHSSSSSSAAPAPRNLFHSHPSPSPRILSNERQFILRNNFVRKSWSWRVFRSGLIAAPPEIAFRDLKTRCSGGGSEKKVRVKTWDLAGGCKCSVDVACMKRSASEGDRRRGEEEENSVAAMNMIKSVNSRTFEWLKQLSIPGATVGELMY